MTRLELLSPLSGWCVALASVPDPVFAEGMAGDGVAIDPTSDTVLAPCDGVVVVAGGHRHAVTLRHGAVEVVMHVGIDTVRLQGRGFTLLAKDGDTVHAGDALLRFDLDALARAAPSLLTPVLVASGGRVATRRTGVRVAAGEPLFDIAIDAPGAGESSRGGELRAALRVPFDHGLHVRPAAKIVTALRGLEADVHFHGNGRCANARSTVAMMTLGVRRGDAVEVVASGRDAQAALEAMRGLFLFVDAGPRAARAAPIAPVAPATGRIAATVASRGDVAGPAAQWIASEVATQVHSRGVVEETAALERAIVAMRDHLETSATTAAGERRALLEGHQALLDDVEMQDAARGAISAGRSAGMAWREATARMADALLALGDARMRERAADLKDLEEQVLRILAGHPPGTARAFPAGCIVVADDLLPSQMMALERQHVGGVCLARGGATAHVAILAAAAGIPMLVGAGAGVLGIPEGTPVVLDADAGFLAVDPPAAEQAARAGAMSRRTVQREADLATARDPAITRDGTRIAVLANLASLEEVAGALRNGAEGSGLLRTEFLFLDRGTAPGEEEQRAQYAGIVAAMQGACVAIRTMDVGGDKPIAYLPMPAEENPALGLRGIRASLREPELLRTQLRAIVRVEGPCRVLLPMVTDVSELHAARAALVQAAADLGRPVPPLGVMIETPSSALLAGTLAPHADFLSIGTNDLAQYTLAMDRGHAELAPRLDALHPAVLALIARVVEGARTHERSVSICGALASDPAALPILVGLGVREFSAAPGAIPALKRVVRGLVLADCEALAQAALRRSTAQEVRAMT